MIVRRASDRPREILRRLIDDLEHAESLSRRVVPIEEILPPIREAADALAEISRSRPWPYQCVTNPKGNSRHCNYIQADWAAPDGGGTNKAYPVRRCPYHAQGGRIVSVARPTAVVVPDNRSYRARYLDDVAPTTMAGRIIKFRKKAPTSSPTTTARSGGSGFCRSMRRGAGRLDQVQRRGRGADRIQGLLYDGFDMPPRETLGDMDQTQWAEGLSGAPDDPWKHQMCLPLQQVDTKEMFCFVTTSMTGRRAVGQLLRHYDRLRRSGSDEVPVVRLRTGGFKHKDSRVGFVKTPLFVVFGKTPRDNAAKPDTSMAAILNDVILL